MLPPPDHALIAGMVCHLLCWRWCGSGPMAHLQTMHSRKYLSEKRSFS